MNSTTAFAATTCIVVGLLCWTWLRTKAQALEHAAEAKRLDIQNAAALAEANLARDMADKGYVQVPVVKELIADASSEAFEDEDNFHERRSWQLAWVPKEQMDSMLAVINPDESDSGVLEAALRPT